MNNILLIWKGATTITYVRGQKEKGRIRGSADSPFQEKSSIRGNFT